MLNTKQLLFISEELGRAMAEEELLEEVSVNAYDQCLYLMSKYGMISEKTYEDILKKYEVTDDTTPIIDFIREAIDSFIEDAAEEDMITFGKNYLIKHFKETRRFELGDTEEWVDEIIDNTVLDILDYVREGIIDEIEKSMKFKYENGKLKNIKW